MNSGLLNLSWEKRRERQGNENGMKRVMWKKEISETEITESQEGWQESLELVREEKRVEPMVAQGPARFQATPEPQEELDGWMNQ